MWASEVNLFVLFRRKEPPGPPTPPPLRWNTLPDAPGRFSSGIVELDAALGGGFPIGSSVALEGDVTTSSTDSFVLGLPAVANFLVLGRGAIIVPPAGVRPGQVRESLVRCVPVTTFESRVRVVDFTAAETEHQWVVPMGRFGRDAAMRAMVAAEKAARGPAGAPTVEFSGLDTYENTTSPEIAVRMFTHGIGRVKEVGNLAIVWMRAGSPASSAVAGMSEYYYRLSRAEGHLWIRGVRPSMPARTIAWNESAHALGVELGLAGQAPG